MKPQELIMCVSLSLALSCGKSTPEGQADLGDQSVPDAHVADMAGSDLGTPDPDTGDVGRVPDATYELLRGQPPTADLGERRTRRVVRGLIHAHSIHSHDACDGEPADANGQPNEPCLQDFRDAICETRQDFVFLTEHEELAAYKEFDALSLVRDGDVPVRSDAGRIIGNRVQCENGHEALIIPGGEFGLMPIGLTDHLEAATPEELDSLYTDETVERVQSYRDQGAVVLQAHSEQRNRDDLRRLNLDGFEVYQLHANVDPNIRADWLGLDGAGFLNAAVPFVQGGGGNPDLLFLTFVEPNQPSLAHFDALVSEGQHLTGTGGTDCHQNVLRMKMTDGERVDGYRRMMRWFSNHLFTDDVSPESLKEAIRDGRLAIVFEVLGTPANHDFFAESAGRVVEMGEEASLADGVQITVPRPEILNWGRVPVRLELLKVEAEGAVVVAEGDDTIEYTVTEPGAYRAVVHITPTHLAPYLDEERAPLAEKEYEWIWFNPIYVGP